MKFPYYAFRGKTAARMIVEQIVLPKDDPGRIERFDTGKTVSRVTYSSWKQSEEVRDGKKMLKFVRRVTIERPKDNTVKNVAVWVDKETMRVMRREEVTPASGKYRMQYRRVADNFRYNETPPPGVFELPKPKVGERYRYMDMEGITADRPENDKAIRALVRKAVDAYNRRDSEAFLALWDWEMVPEAQRRARQSQWRDAVIRQTPYVTWRYAAMATGLSAVHEYVRKSESEPFPPPFPTTVDSKLGGWVTTKSARKPVLVPATFTCTKHSGSWKIQQLQLATKPLPGDWLKGKR